MNEMQDALGSPERRASTLRRLADHLLSKGAHLTEEQIRVFDQVLLALVNACETEELADLAQRFAAIAFAPPGTLRHLASHSDLRVAGPVLNDSPSLSNDDLLGVAVAQGQGHLLAMSKRKVIDEALSDALIELGNRDVRFSVAVNEGAKVTVKGFEQLVASAKGDALLTEKTGLRPELPLNLFTTLLQRSGSAVRARLLAKTPAQRRAQVQRTVDLMEQDDRREAERPRDFRSAKDVIQGLMREGRLTESKLAEFASRREYESIVVALAQMASAPVELIRPLMRAHRSDGLLVACRAAELEWMTTQLVLRSRLTVSAKDLEKLRARFEELSVSNAKRTLGIWKEQALGPRRRAL